MPVELYEVTDKWGGVVFIGLFEPNETSLIMGFSLFFVIFFLVPWILLSYVCIDLLDKLITDH